MHRLLSCLFALLVALGIPALAAAEASTFALRPAAQVTGDGVFLHQLVNASDVTLPTDVKVAEAPLFGRSVVLTRDRVFQTLKRALGESAGNALTGATGVLVTRASRELRETEVLLLLREALQREIARDRGELELRLGRPWNVVAVPDEPLELRLVDVPATGLSPVSMVRFEMRTATDSAGAWQVVLQVKLMREVWTVRNSVRRGAPLAPDDLVRERRDVINAREPLADFASLTGDWEAADFLAAGATVLARSLRPQVAMRRGQMVEAIVDQGSMRISLRVEVLEDGAPGDLVRLRNPVSRKELKGKVQDEHSVLVYF